MTHRIIQLAKWSVKSIGGLSVNLLLLTVWVDGLQLPPELAVLINWVLISLASYWLTDNWIFPSQGSDSHKQHAIRYFGMEMVMLFSKAVNYLIYLVLLSENVDYRIAWTVGAGAVFFVSFFGTERWWRVTTSDANPE
jgi:putative flippase GtrA